MNRYMVPPNSDRLADFALFVKRQVVGIAQYESVAFPVYVACDADTRQIPKCLDHPEEVRLCEFHIDADLTFIAYR